MGEWHKLEWSDEEVAGLEAFGGGLLDAVEKEVEMGDREVAYYLTTAYQSIVNAAEKIKERKDS